MPLCFPTAMLMSLLAYYLVGIRLGINKKERLIASAITLLIILFSVLISMLFYDLSWDGQWYHQAAIYHLESGWNPILKPITSFDQNNDLSIIHFPKGAWYFAATVLSTFNNLEGGKSINWIVLFAAAFFIYATLKDAKFSKKHAVLLTVMVLLNPVVWSEITTYLVDGLLFLYVTIYAMAMVGWARNGEGINLVVGLMAAVLLINIKFTGLVFFCVFAFYIAIYVAVKKKNALRRFFYPHCIAIALALLMFGFNPYVTNFMQRGHPFYPIGGTKDYPSIFEQTGRDDNELFETPQNMIGKNFFMRFIYATFGRPGNAPYNNEKEAKLIWPFTSKVSDWKAYYYHETRVSGFGPFFSGIFVLSASLMTFIFCRNKKARWLLLLGTLAICTCLLISKHFWWPRFAPQTWLLILLPVFFLLHPSSSFILRKLAEGMSLLIAFNGLVVLTMHMGWEWRASNTLRNELLDMQRHHTAIEIDYGWFKKSMTEKLNRAGIKFKAVSGEQVRKGAYKTLTSVVEGYPNVVIYRDSSD